MISYVGMLAQSNVACRQLLSNACKAYTSELSEISTEYEELEARFSTPSKELFSKTPSSTYKPTVGLESGHSNDPLYSTNTASTSGSFQRRQSLLLPYRLQETNLSAVTTIHKELFDVLSAMHTMTEMLSHQGNMIDRIDLNVEASLQHLKAANVAFAKTEQYQLSYGKNWLVAMYALFFLAIIGAIIKFLK